jgi:hypothetical protein
MSRLKPKPGGPPDITPTVGGNLVGEGQVPVSSSMLFTANDRLDVGTCLSSRVSLDTAKGTVTVQRHGSPNARRPSVMGPDLRGRPR